MCEKNASHCRAVGRIRASKVGIEAYHLMAGTLCQKLDPAILAARTEKHRFSFAVAHGVHDRLCGGYQIGVAAAAPAGAVSESIVNFIGFSVVANDIGACH